MEKEKKDVLTEEEQVKDTAVLVPEESDPKEIETKEEEEVAEVATYLAPTEEELTKLIQSTSSKAKNEILKAIGIDSVEGIKAKISLAKTLESITNEIENLKFDLDAERARANNAEDSLLVTKLNVNPQNAEMFLQMVKSDTSGEDRETVALRLKNELTKGTLFNDQPLPPINIGNYDRTSGDHGESVNALRKAMKLD